MKNFFRILIVSTFLISTPTTPVITFLSKHMTPQGKTVYVVGDHHLTHPGDSVGKAQAASLLKFAQALPQVLVIAEDILDYTGTNEEIKKDVAFIKTLQKTPLSVPGEYLHLNFGGKDLGWQQAAVTSPLSGFVEQCTQATVPCCSIEFRHARDASMKNANITCSEVLESLDSVKHEIEHYQDGTKLERYYDFAINTYLNEPQRKLLQAKESVGKSIQQSFSALSKDFMIMGLFGISLMVPRILHAIHTNESKNNLIIFVGDEHAKNLTQVLSKLFGHTTLEVVYKEPRTDKDNHIAYVQISALDLDTYFEQELKQLKATTSQEIAVQSATTAASSSSSSSTSANSASSTTTVELQKS